jgi:hypothetical protein
MAGAGIADPVFRARAAREPRKVLAEVGVHLPEETEIRVRDSSGTARWFVIRGRASSDRGFYRGAADGARDDRVDDGHRAGRSAIMRLHGSCTTDQGAPRFDHEWQ